MHNNWININLIDDVTYDAEYEHIHQIIIYGIISNISLIISEGNICYMDVKDSYYVGYYVINIPQIHT